MLMLYTNSVVAFRDSLPICFKPLRWLAGNLFSSLRFSTTNQIQSLSLSRRQGKAILSQNDTLSLFEIHLLGYSSKKPEGQCPVSERRDFLLT
uniref:Uncharacterized protein n=1 Tax=Anguilla anguilla TaxID=7936 RepID=A0A0E9P9Q4_ANGAN